ncbi:YciI family protein [Microbacterium sp. zg.B48]|uniref:YciI family protein n=1 Tax=unclassified Microbacterium TaxID=2609290 RepID=UPI00214BF516|nr:MULTISPECIES: YciI family protein [unclassified Microbacterium]MCR2763706.1 YciI family protein [Microbacterium sp. zg.B48]MCR2809426.1 YciI family protein [Microbacterium sp. zg.B185]WIM20561.1 YciI family protein [Microbacterium sp. zg-B185]
MAQWLYRIVPARPGLPDAADEHEEAVADHLDYVQALKSAGILILAGRMPEDPTTPAITIIEAPDEETARAVMQTDPAVAAGVMTATLYPYALAAGAEQ